MLGAVAGADHDKFLLSDHTDSLYGITLQWKPTQRTDLSVSLEHRFFGQGGDLTFTHRTPFMSFSIAASRQPTTSSSSLGVAGSGSDVRGLLDAILTTRYPDASVRSGLVDNIVSSRGIDTKSQGAVDLVADYPQLQTAVNASWALLGTRNTLTLNLYALTARQLTREGDPLSSAAIANNDTRQAGGSIAFNRRLTRQLSVDLSASWSKITGLAARAGETSDQRMYRFSMQKSLSPRTNVSGGLQRTEFTTTAAGQNSFDATLLFIGMSHRF